MLSEGVEEVCLDGFAATFGPGATEDAVSGVAQGSRDACTVSGGPSGFEPPGVLGVGARPHVTVLVDPPVSGFGVRVRGGLDNLVGVGGDHVVGVKAGDELAQ